MTETIKSGILEASEIDVKVEVATITTTATVIGMMAGLLAEARDMPNKRHQLRYSWLLGKFLPKIHRKMSFL